ncbi:hypothetical protein [Pseudomonas chlororaphis]|uniref:hypothetical protein n=1 Tax=Pseudomonas chlororaphis TaxID=587753 RepID=UPI000F54F84F|nr:hypothetical protein [Pseudomonas chlororaphis]AZD50527.1 hypothetical protein C4K20_5136 [Pseudomonas chlororaphis subsp. aurantiaca]
MSDHTELKNQISTALFRGPALGSVSCTVDARAVQALFAELESLKAEIPGWTERELLLITENEALLEVAARTTYETWSQQPGYVPWVEHGNSLKQEEARAMVRAAMSKGEQS